MEVRHESVYFLLLENFYDKEALIGIRRYLLRDFSSMVFHMRDFLVSSFGSQFFNSPSDRRTFLAPLSQL